MYICVGQRFLPAQLLVVDRHFLEKAGQFYTSSVELDMSGVELAEIENVVYEFVEFGRISVYSV